MVIVTLSEDTMRLLGSPTVISTPVDLVKELLENALDAKATFVEILVAPNLVDRIEVRDNGHGIFVEDYDSLGRPGHTSKITSFDDISILGGTVLGFRGQALASANTLGNITVTTRTAEDPTATLLQLRAGVGGLDSTKRVSAPVGTSVSVTGLYGNMPVRELFVIKEAPKHIIRIKQMLQEYALAKPGIRLSFRSLGGTAKWSYFPRPQATVREAVIQVFGTELMSHCMIRSVHSGQVDGQIEAIQHNEQMSIQAVLPSTDGDLTKISKGAFFAVDSRPMATATGTMKKLLKKFKSHFVNALKDTNGLNVPRDPFLFVNIKCLPGAYDPNIEPSKNQVLFANESRLVDLFERLCKEVYKTRRFPDVFETVQRRRLSHGSQIQTPPASSDSAEERTNIYLQISSPDHPHKLRSDYSNAAVVRENDVEGAAQSARMNQYFISSPGQSPAASSGFGFSKISYKGLVPVRPQVYSTPEQENSTSSVTKEVNNIEANLHSLNPSADIDSSTTAEGSSLYHQSSDSAPNTCTSRDPDVSSDEEAEMLAFRFRGQPDTQNRVHGCERPTVLPSPRTLARSTAPILPTSGNDAYSEGDVLDMVHPLAQQVDQGAEDSFDDLPIIQPYGSLAEGFRPARPTHLASTHTAHQPQRPIVVPANELDNSQYTSPTNHFMEQTQEQSQPQSDDRYPLPSSGLQYNDFGGSMGPDGLKQTRICFGGPRLPQQSRSQQAQLHVEDLSSRPSPPYCKPWKGRKRGNAPETKKVRNTQDHSLDHEHNHHIDFVGHDEMAPLNYEYVVHQESRDLHSLDKHQFENPITSRQFSTDNNGKHFEMDCRKYLMRRQRSDADHQRKGRPLLKRAKSDMLPLERVPNNYETQQLILTMVTDVERLGDTRTNPSKGTAFVSESCTETKLGQDLSLEDAAEIETNLRSLLNEWTETTLGQKIDVEINLGALVKGKIIAT